MSLEREHRDADRDAPIPAMGPESMARCEWDFLLTQWRRKVDPTDVLDELVDFEDQLRAMTLAKDAKGIGELYLRTHEAYAVRLAQGDVQ
jgi:hypothetical protein